MSTLHTPGPWRAELGVIVADIPNDGFKTTAVAYYGDEWRHADGLQYGDERDANGRLIAAAPDGLALARAVAAHFEGTDAPLGQMARDLIAKAEGKP